MANPPGKLVQFRVDPINIYANKIQLRPKEEVGPGGSSNKKFGGYRDVTSKLKNAAPNVTKERPYFQTPIVITFGPIVQGMVIRYTFNGVDVTLGSKVYDPLDPPTIYSAGDGFANTLTIKCKVYLNGMSSKTTECVLRVQKAVRNGTTKGASFPDGKRRETFRGSKKVYSNLNPVVKSKTGK
jgi:hypothetical protein